MIDCYCPQKELSTTEQHSSSLSLPSLVAFTLTPQIHSHNQYAMNPLEIISNGQMTYEKTKFIESYTNLKLNYKWLQIQSYFIYKNNNSDTKLALIYFKHTINNPKVKPFTILYSHDNSSTLGGIYPFLCNLSNVLKCDVISYDYSGYGQSTGKLDERELFSDIEEVYSFMTKILLIQSEKVVLMGSHVGTTVTINLGSKDHCKKISHMILISPIPCSDPSLFHYKAEKKLNEIVLFNYKKLRHLTCPVLLIHGYIDNVIPIKDVEEIEKFISTVYTWYPKEGDHVNIVTDFLSGFIKKCKRFLRYYDNNYNNEVNQYANKVYVNKNIFNEKEVLFIEGTGCESNKTFLSSSEDSPFSEQMNNNLDSNINSNKGKPCLTIKDFEVYEL